MAATTGGATFYPMLNPRPLAEYRLCSRQVIIDALICYVRAPFVCTLFTILLQPWYFNAVDWWKSNGIWGGDDKMFFTFAYVISKAVTAIVCHSFFAFIERFSYLDHYKIDRKQFQLPTWDLIRSNLRDVAIGTFITGPPFVYFGLITICSYFDPLAWDAPLPSWNQLYIVYVVCYLLNDWGFYWTHRLLHSKSIYGYFHKQHHSYTGTVSYAAEYAHPVETILSNYLPTLAGCVVMGAHPLLHICWVMIRLQQTYETHSGFSFRGSWLYTIGLTNGDAALWHDFHHTQNTGNFGAVYLDWIFGTMDSYLAIGGHDAYNAKQNDQRFSYLRRVENVNNSKSS